MIRKIRTKGWQCTCGCQRFYFESHGADGGFQTWTNVSCQKCGTKYELWDGYVDYKFIEENLGS